MAAGKSNQRRDDCGSDRAAEKTGKRMNRKCAAHARFVHVGGKDRIIRRVIDAIGQPQQHRARNQPGITQIKAQHDQRQPADGEADQQDFARADMIGKVTHGRLRHSGDHRKHGQRKAKLDIADAELLFQEGEQHRQREDVKMAEPVRNRNRRQRPQRAVGFRVSRSGENVDHIC